MKIKLILGMTVALWADVACAQNTAFAAPRILRNSEAGTPVGTICRTCLGQATNQCASDDSPIHTLVGANCVLIMTASRALQLRDMNLPIN